MNTGRSRGSLLIFFVVGALFLGIGIWLLNNNLARIDSGISIGAKVTQIDTYHSKGKTMYTPVVQFTTKNGEVISTKLELSSSSPEYNVGDTVNVIYQADKPQDVLQDTTFAKYGFPGIFIGLGGFAVLVSLLGGLKRILFGRV